MISKEWLYRKLSLIEPYLLPIVVILVGLTAFGLGRLSVVGEGGPRVMSTTAAVVASKSSDKYIASKTGTKYYLPSCSGASKIKEENKVWFATVAEAQASGYTAAANCPGL